MTISRLPSLIAILGVALAVAYPESVVAADATQHAHSNAADSTAKSAAMTPAPASSTSAMHQMHAAHEKMMAAKTPAERQAAMGEHSKAMQDGMKAMHQDDGCQGCERWRPGNEVPHGHDDHDDADDDGSAVDGWGHGGRNG